MQVKNQIQLLQVVDSTNNYAMGQVHEGMAGHGAAWLAKQQTQGKGQHGKQWQTAAGENIMMSIVLDAQKLLLQSQFGLSAAIAAACHGFVSSYTGSHVFIKWPNDIFCNDSKAGGILIENIVQGQAWKWAIAGLGINTNQTVFPEHLANATSLKIITGIHYRIMDMAAELHRKVLFYFKQLTSDNRGAIMHYYNNNLYKRGQAIRIHVKGRSFTGTLKGITDEGKLVIEETEEEFSYGDLKVEW